MRCIDLHQIIGVLGVVRRKLGDLGVEKGQRNLELHEIKERVAKVKEKPNGKATSPTRSTSQGDTAPPAANRL